MSAARLLTDAVIAATAGFAGTKSMERFNMFTYENIESDADRQREDAVRPGPPPKLAVQRLARKVAGIELSDDQAMKAGMAVHQLAGLSWTPIYMLLRRGYGWRPVTAGLTTGASMSLLVDEVVTPAIGASAANADYPISTHVRAFIAHLLYGLTVAGVIEAGWRLTRATSAATSD